MLRQDEVDFQHNGETISALRRMFPGLNSSDYKYILIFDYKGLNVVEHYTDATSDYHIIGPITCKMIDDIGIDNYNQLSKKRDIIRQIQRANVIIDYKVYGEFEKYEHSGYHLMYMKMEDGTNLSGESKFDFFKEEEKKDKRKTLNNLIDNVLNYYKQHKIVPDRKHFVEDLSTQYEEIHNWFIENVPQSYHENTFKSQHSI